MEKIIHTEGHPESFAELHGEEKREKRDRSDRDRRGGIKGQRPI